MKIVADENIPLVKNYFSGLGELVLKPGRLISQQDLTTADILLVRSVTKVNEVLLHDTPIKFVGSTTTGFDHMDIDWLNQAGIAWSIAKGCNATAVVEYVLCVIAALQKMGHLTKSSLRAGVIGVGEIGAQVVQKLTELGFDVIVCDPLRAEQESEFISTSLDQFADLDFITIHTPLTHVGRYPTYHMINQDFLTRQKPGCVLLNTSRGEVIDFQDLKQYGEHLIWCLDVWEHEPHIDSEILKNAAIATPHIAGYSVQGKMRGVEMIYHAACDAGIIHNHNSTEMAYPKKIIHHRPVSWQDAALTIYDPVATTQVMKKILLNNPDKFDELRKNFPERHEFLFVDWNLC